MLFDNFNEISNFKTFADFKNFGESLDNSNACEIEKYLKLVYSPKNPIYYHCELEYNSITNTSNYKYVIFDFKCDKVLIMFKVVQFMTTKQIKIYDKPISLNKNIQHEKEIVEWLLSFPFVKIVYNQNFVNFYSRYQKVYELQDNNYYYTYEIQSNRYTNKYKHDRKINRFENNKDFFILFTNYAENKQEIENIREKWANMKNQKISSDKEFKKFLYSNSNNMRFLLIYYKNELISCSIYLKSNNYYIFLYEYTLGRLKSEDIYLHNSLKNIEEIALYFTYQNAIKEGIDYIYILGANPEHIELVNHKERVSNGKLAYYKLERKLV